MQTTLAMTALVISASALISGCAGTGNQASSTQPYPSSTQTYPSPTQSYTSYGTIDSIQTVRGNTDTSVGLGTVAGGVVGGLLGSQVGKGNGNTAATVAGAVGGAVVGHQIEKSNRAQTADTYQVNVRLDNGGYQTVTQDSVNDLRTGDRVRIDGGRVYRY